MSGVAMTGDVRVSVAAPVESVWRVVADVTRTGEWSHECHQVRWLGGARAAAPGVRFRGRNRSGWLRWSRTCEVLAVDAPRELVWRTIPTWRFVDSSDWRIRLDSTDDGTLIQQSFQVTKCPSWWEWIVARMVRAHLDRTAALTEDLRRLGAIAAHSDALSPSPSIRRRSRDISGTFPDAAEDPTGASAASEGSASGARPGGARRTRRAPGPAA